MKLNVTFNNISVISCQSVLLVEETGVPARQTVVIDKCFISNKEEQLTDLSSLNSFLRSHR